MPKRPNQHTIYILNTNLTFRIVSHMINHVIGPRTDYASNVIVTSLQLCPSFSSTESEKTQTQHSCNHQTL